MRTLTLEQKVNRKLRVAFVCLLFVTLLVNAIILAIDIRTMTGNILGTFIQQIGNVARVSVQKGDILSLQKDLEAVAFPLANTFFIDIEICKKIDGKEIVSINPLSKKNTGIFNKTLIADLEVIPFGTLETRIKFDLSEMILIAIFKSLVSSSIIILALFLVQFYVGNENRKSLSPIDQFSSWIEKVPIEDFINREVRVPTEGISTELSNGFKKLVEKIQNLSSELASLESDRKMGVLVRRLAHDIRSPLTALNILSANLKSKHPDESLVLDEVSSRIISMAGELLGQSRDLMKVPQEKETVVAGLKGGTSRSYREIVGACEAIVREKKLGFPGGNQVRFSFFSSGEEGGNFICDLDELQRVISNLLNNAFDATQEGFVSLSISVDFVGLLIEVRDSGTGMSQDLIEKVYMRPTTEGKINGNGLGLFSAIQEVASWGGEIKIKSEEGRGTTVSIILT